MSRPTLHDRINEFPVGAHDALKGALLESDSCGVIPPSVVEGLGAATGLGVHQLLLALVPASETYSIAPISGLHIGSVALGLTGAMYFGANMEFPGGTLAMSVHAEQAAVTHAWLHGERGLQALSVGGRPCGHCRQFLNETTTAKEMVFVTPSGSYPMGWALPDDFGPGDLGNPHGFMHHQHQEWRSVPLALSLGPVGDPAPPTVAQRDQVVAAALAAVEHSYAPYSQAPSGVGVLTRSGRVVSGPYIENAAFNPSLSPLTVALIHLNLAHETLADIDRVVLAERSEAAVSQRASCQVILGDQAAHRLEVINPDTISRV